MNICRYDVREYAYDRLCIVLLILLITPKLLAVSLSISLYGILHKRQPASANENPKQSKSTIEAILGNLTHTLPQKTQTPTPPVAPDANRRSDRFPRRHQPVFDSSTDDVSGSRQRL